MKIKSIASKITALALVAAMTGCLAAPLSTTTVDQSVLPASAKSLLPQDAVITRVEKESYRDGAVIYIIRYTLDGRNSAVRFNPAERTVPSGVFNAVDAKR